MNRHQKASLATGIAVGLGSAGVAEAATHAATLVSYGLWSNSGLSAGNITSSTATWSYDDVTSVMTQTGGLLNARFTVAPTTTLFRTSITGLVVGNGGAAAASTYVCTEGNFGAGVGASICGNYNFGGDLVNDSSVTYGPGTASARTLGGDDAALGPQQSLADLDGLNTVSWVGTNLTLSNAACTGSPSACAATGGFNSGYRLVFQVVPVPAAVWLFGSGLALLGVARRRPAAA
ncbi:MAG: VPLPA-CTERM sorting domain-containing protein [Chromatiales bacterium]|nr:VPLPA-CTERM sorting domain-containing protein [Chromatiales bacterium]